MNKTKWLTCLLLVIFSLLLVPQQQEKIREEVTVINVEVPVRVFYKGKTVAGLKKSDFKLLVGRKEVPIHGFNEYRKKIQLKELEKKEQPEIKPRLFLIILNVSDYNDEVAQNVDYLFDTIIRKGDRLILLSNNFFINDHLMLDIEKEKNRFVRIAELEAKKIKKEVFHLENKLERIVNDFSKRMQDALEEAEMGKNPTGVEPFDIYYYFQNFVSDYLRTFSEFNDIYFGLQETQYLQMANYLSEQSCEMWGINFYQIGLFPELKRAGKIYTTMEAFRRQYEAGNGAGDPQSVAWLIDLLFQKMDQNLHGSNYRGEEEIAKPFINTGVSLHTLLMKPMSRRTLQHFVYKPVKIESENILRKISTMTGGQVIEANKAEEFVEKIVEVEDVYYRLTFDPARAGVDVKAKIKVKTNYPNYKLIFDNQQRPQYIKDIETKVKSRTVPILVDQLRFENRILSFAISNISIPETGEGSTGKVRVGIKIIDSSFNVIHDREKTIIPDVTQDEIRVGFSKLPAGKYDLVVEITDLITGRNDLVLKEINISSKKGIIGTKAIESIESEMVKTTEQGKTFIFPTIKFARKAATSQPPAHHQNYPVELKELLASTASYCQRLDEVSLYFYCRENINEILYDPFLRDRSMASETDQAWVDYGYTVDYDIKGSDKLRPTKRVLKNSRFLYDYQLVQEKNQLREKRRLVELDNKKVDSSDNQLKTRFKYKHIIFGPLIFGAGQQEVYDFKLIGSKRLKGRKVKIVEAQPLEEFKQGLISARFWIDEKDSSILKMEVKQSSIQNFEKAEQLARRLKITPQITIVQEYNTIKNGIRFPSLIKVEEAYLTSRSRIKFILSKTTIKYSDYKFFTVGTKVTEEKIKK